MSDTSKHPQLAQTRMAALGYLRTYAHLIQYESDFRIAQDPALCLVPAEVTWFQFCKFSANLLDIADEEVSGRYCYGEIRLTRLNYYAPLLLGRTHYQKVEYQYRAYFAQFQAPVLFIFAFLSIVLNSMQVYLAATGLESKLTSFLLIKACFWFSIITGVLSCLLLLILAALFVFKIAREWRFAIWNRLQRRKAMRRLSSDSA
jgi:hypothetical protein